MTEHLRTEGEAMTEHLPECSCCDDEEFQHGFCGNFVGGRCLHCMAECICEHLLACEERVKDEALAQARAREVNGVTFAQSWALATNACIDAFYSRISDSDLDDLLSDDEKDIVAHAIRNARQRGN